VNGLFFYVEIFEAGLFIAELFAVKHADRLKKNL